MPDVSGVVRTLNIAECLVVAIKHGDRLSAIWPDHWQSQGRQDASIRLHRLLSRILLCDGWNVDFAWCDGLWKFRNNHKVIYLLYYLTNHTHTLHTFYIKANSDFPPLSWFYTVSAVPQFFLFFVYSNIVLLIKVIVAKHMLIHITVHEHT